MAVAGKKLLNNISSLILLLVFDEFLHVIVLKGFFFFFLPIVYIANVDVLLSGVARLPSSGLLLS